MNKLTRRKLLSMTAALSAVACTRSRPLGSRPEVFFDVVVVGAGSAGAVVASRLSEDPNRRVLLLEAGGEADHELVNNPARWFGLLGSSLVYPDMTQPQVGLGGKTLFAGHGRTIGGSSTINAMIHHRPTPEDINEWGLSNWTWNDLAPMLAHSERWSGPASALRGSTGPIGVMELPDPPPLATSVLEAAENLGLGVSDDINGASQSGAAVNQLAFAHGLRQHTGQSFLTQARNRPNLRVVTNAQVRSLRLSEGQCHGLTYRYQGETLSIDSARVVLCAGALRTPQILMLSGIGPGPALQNHGIDVVVNNSGIGANLHDHLLVSGNSFETTQPVAKSKFHGSVAVVYANSGGRSSSRDLLLNVSTSGNVIPPLESAGSGFKTSFSFTKPKSRGQLSLASRDPDEPPLINVNYLTNPADVKGMTAALNLSRRLLKNKTFSHFNGRELNKQYFADRQGLLRFFSDGATPFGHYCGTCRMGGDPDSPVDGQLRVRGISGLDVVDASVIPSIPSCPTNPTVVAIAELYAARFGSN